MKSNLALSSASLRCEALPAESFEYEIPLRARLLQDLEQYFLRLLSGLNSP